MNITKELNILLEDFKFTPRRIEGRKEKQKDKKLKILTSYIHKFCNSEPELVEKFKKVFGVDKYAFREVMPKGSKSGTVLIYIFQTANRKDFSRILMPKANSEDYFRILITDDNYISLTIFSSDFEIKANHRTNISFLRNFQDIIKMIHNLKDNCNEQKSTRKSIN